MPAVTPNCARMPFEFSPAKKPEPVRLSLVYGFSGRPAAQRALWEAACPLKDGERVRAAALPISAGRSVRWEAVVRVADDFSVLADGEAAAAAAAAKLRELDADAQVDLTALKLSAADESLLAQLLCAAGYRFDEFKSKKTPSRAWRFGPGHKFDAADLRERDASLRLARDLVNRPPNVLHPETFEAAVRQALAGLAEVHAIRGAHLAGKGLNGIWCVGRASVHAPRLVWAQYRGDPSSKAWDWALVGKGVTFDAGGYNLKPTGAMEDMKCDMAGAAAVLAAIRHLAATKAKANVVALFPLAENLVSGDAYKPGDVIRMYDGQTVEIANTDAEGRLLLGDALAFAQDKFAPAAMVDIATLTGAQLIALGNDVAAVVGPDAALNRALQDLGWSCLERCWELPFHKPYLRAYDSKVADFSNGSWAGRYNPGTIQGALFLSKFVKKGRWAHLDIAGPAGSFHASSHPLFGYGATGFGARLLAEAVLRGVAGKGKTKAASKKVAAKKPAPKAK